MSKPPRVFEKIVALLQRLLGPLSDEELLRLLRRRLNTSDEALKGLLAADGVAEELGKQGVAMVKETRGRPHIRRMIPPPLELCCAFLVWCLLDLCDARAGPRGSCTAGALI